MAENKKSFIAYSDWHGMFHALPDEVAGKLIKHIFSYVNDENPSSEDFIINALFEQIKATLKRDLIKWDKERIQRSDAGKKSAELRSIKFNERSTEVNELQRKATVSVSDSVNENEINKDIDFKKPSLENCIEIFKTKTAFNWTENYALKSANTFYYFYESKNWMVGKNKMKSLNAAIGGWISRDTKPELSTTKTQEQINKEKLDYFKTQGFQI
jgi:hypothetical protein